MILSAGLLHYNIKMKKLFHDADVEQAYRDKLRASMRGAIDFARRRQELRRLAGKKPANVTLTLSEVMIVLQQQGYRCALTRLPFYSLGGDSYGPSRPSIDRIQHAGPYSLGNVRIILLGVNSLRGSGSDTDMYVIARALAASGRRLRRITGSEVAAAAAQPCVTLGDRPLRR